MQLSSASVLQNINNLAAQGNYVAAYQATLADLKANNPNPSLDDNNVITWLQTAINVNSGAHTLDAIAVRANNVAAMEYEKGYTIDMFGTEQQNSSNAVANAFFTSLKSGNGTIQNFNQIANLDATNGLKSLGNLSNAAWAGAVPGAYDFITGLYNSDYYNALTTSQQAEADRLHVVAANIITEYKAAEVLGVPENVKNALVGDIAAEANESNAVVSVASGIYSGAAAVSTGVQSLWNGISNYFGNSSSGNFSTLQNSLNSLEGGNASGNASLAFDANTTATVTNANAATFKEVNNGQSSTQQITNANNMITNNVSGVNAVASMNNTTINLTAGASATINGDNNSFSLGLNSSANDYFSDGTRGVFQRSNQLVPGVDETVASDYSASNVLMQQNVLNNANGTFSLTQYWLDGVTQSGKDTYNAQGVVTNDSWLTTENVTQFANVTASALATQVIAQFLFKNNLPASAVAQGFSNVAFNNSQMNAANAALYNGLSAQQKFTANFGLAVANDNEEMKWNFTLAA